MNCTEQCSSFGCRSRHCCFTVLWESRENVVKTYCKLRHGKPEKSVTDDHLENILTGFLRSLFNESEE